MTQATLDQTKMEAFVGKVLGDTSAVATIVMSTLGDRLGLYKDLAANGPATSAELAARTATNERYVREWLGGMSSAGYLTYEPTTQRFTLPAEHIPVLAQEGGPVFFGGVHQELLGALGPVTQLIQAFQKGGGIDQAEYDENFWDGLERFSSGWFENLLVPVWLEALPHIRQKLERGVRLADVGCGRGRALVKLAQTFPNSRFTGYDLFEPTINRARARAQQAGVADRVEFHQLDVSKGLPEQYDLITTFDVVHDAIDPRGMLRSIRRGLKPDGQYLCLEINCSDKLEENAGPVGTLFHGFSIMYCMTTSLAHGGEGLGTLGLPESKLRQLCAEAGFSRVRRVALDNPFNSLYEIDA